jgi:peptidoglycan/xylan/chitin deacetylase (PgdA/CDA1 family)
MKKIVSILILIILAGFLFWKFFIAKGGRDEALPRLYIADQPNNLDNKENNKPVENNNPISDYEKLREKINDKYKNIIPKIWSETAPGVMTKLDTTDKVLAMTFDACGSVGDGFDSKLINYLTENKIPATLFISGKWIDKNPENFKTLTQNPLFEIENHGTNHIPCSISGKSAYNIQGTKNPGEVVDEIEKNAERIETLTGRKPQFYRDATTFSDEVCPQIANDLGEKMVSYSVLGDAGATYNAAQIKIVLEKAPAGSIVIAHMNHPEKQTAEGMMAVLPELQKEGFRFVKLEDYQLK